MNDEPGTVTTTTGTGRGPLTDRGRRTRHALVAAARVVFEDKGFSATRMGDISVQAGVSHGTVYTYFDTKDDLLAAAVKQLVADIRASIRTAESDDPVERVWNANQRYLTAYLSHARLMRVVEEAGATDPQFAEIVADLRRTHADRVASQIRKLQAAEVVPDDIEPEAASRALCAMVEGFARNWTAQVDADLVGSTRALTQLWVNSLGLDVGSAASTESYWAAGSVPRGRTDQESDTAESSPAQESSPTQLEANDAVHARA